MKHRYRFTLRIVAVFLSGLALQAAEEGRDTEVPQIKPITPPAPKSVQQKTIAAPQKSGAKAATPLPPTTQQEKLYSLSFESAPLDTVLTMYSEWAGRTVLKTDKTVANITLKGKDLTKRECMDAIETVLSMNNVALVPLGEKFLKVVLTTAPDFPGQGLPLTKGEERVFPTTGQLVTHIVTLKHVEIPEVQAAVQHLMHAFGKIQTLDSNNSMMITDTADNMQRIREIISFLDQPAARIEPRVYHIQFAEAGEIAAKLNEVVEMAMAAKQKDSKKPTTTSRSRVTVPVGVIRARRPGEARTPTQAAITSTEGSDAVIIQGLVKIMADERTNIVIIFSQEENFDFFDRIIEVLDVEVEPAVSFEVVQLEYADAEEISATLNDLVGSVQGGTSTSTSRSKTSSKSSSSSSNRSRTGTTQRGGTSLAPRVSPKATTTETAQSLSKLSESTKILADQRTNSLLLMGRKDDIAALKDVIAGLDIMLEQVLIEAAIFEIDLDDTLETGLQWFLRDMDTQGEYAGAWGDSKLPLLSPDGTPASDNSLILDSALTYYMQLNGINAEAAIRLSKDDAHANLLSTPVVMTTDNTEATITVGEQRPVVTSTETTSQSINSLRSQYEYKDIGIELKVTPRINPQKFVVMEIVQTADQIAGSETIDGNNVPIIANREIEATVMVPNRGTIALGGLVNSEKKDTESKIPILGSIPYIGKYLFGNTLKQLTKRELIVLLTPYVLTSPEEMLKETQRVYSGLGVKPKDWPQGWSDSNLSKEDPTGDTQELSKMLEETETSTPENK